MNKKVTRMIFAALVAVLVSGTVLPTTAMVFAAEQNSQEQPAPADAPKDGGNEHSGHHM
ncbi:MAG: hypothetical protein K0R78_1098 [Pelosinus sp.]|jgi:hypothetical protein|nr:hypothetical protein [Pelosinus sp.]